MATTIRINEEVKQRLKLQSIETGISQLDLANRYILEGIKHDKTPKKPIKTIEEIEKILKHDKKAYEKPERINLDEYEIPEKIKKENESGKSINSIEEIEKILDHDRKEKDTSLDDIVGIIKTDEMVDSVKLKKDSYKQG